VIEASQISTILDLSNNSRFGKKWMECIHKEWLRELKKKEKEVGNLWRREPRWALSSVEVLKVFK